MARVAKEETNIQVFRGSKPRQDVFSANAGHGCCDETDVLFDKLGARVRFDNALAHSNPRGGNDRWGFRRGIDADTAKILQWLEDNGVGASVSVLVVPTFAFVSGVGIKIQAMEEGVTFNIKTRNGLDILDEVEVIVVDTGHDGSCTSTHTLSAEDLEGFGALPEGVVVRDIFILPNATPRGNFSLEADEIILELASVPADGIVKGEFLIDVAVNYEIINRAEY